MLHPHDRRDLACLGLMVLAYGLVVAPVLHTVVGHAGTSRQHVHTHGAGEAAHAHGREQAGPHAQEAGAHGQEQAHGRDAGKKHGPGAPEKQPGHGHQHLTGSVEHLSGVVASWVVAEPPRVRWVSWRVEGLSGPERAPGGALRPTAMPQGP